MLTLGQGSHCDLGPVGVAARVVVGVFLIYLAFFWNDASWVDPVAGLVVFPAVVTGLLALRARRSSGRLVATGPVGHLANCVVILALILNPVTAGAAMIFYGASMLLAATRRAGHCEVSAISNVILGRRDEVGCPLFWPLDTVESAIRRGGRGEAAA